MPCNMFEVLSAEIKSLKLWDFSYLKAFPAIPCTSKVILLYSCICTITHNHDHYEICAKLPRSVMLYIVLHLYQKEVVSVSCSYFAFWFTTKHSSDTINHPLGKQPFWKTILITYLLQCAKSVMDKTKCVPNLLTSFHGFCSVVLDQKEGVG